MITLFKIEKLKEQIKNGQLSEKDKFIYFFLYVIIDSILYELLSYDAQLILNPTIWDYSHSIIVILITIIGTYIAYKSNGGSNGVDFLGRYFSIGFVVMIRFFVFLIPSCLILFILYFINFGEDESNNELITFLYKITLVSFYYWFLYKHISEIKNSN